MKNNNQTIDVLCIGEVLIDFIGHQHGVKISNTRDYHRYLGGSPANVAMNVARLGLKSEMVSTVGNDGFGSYIFKRLTEAGVGINNMATVNNKTTSIIFISRTDGTPDFMPFRDADYHITEQQLPTKLLLQSKVYHTTCFALSKSPARETILAKAKEAQSMGCTLSIDVNYAQKLWESQEQALQAITAYCALNPLVKISEDDMLRLFERKLPHDEIFNFFHKCGVDTVCLTLGSKGVKLSQKGKAVIERPAIKIERILDATGAGDAFWSGFLFAYINNKPISKCLDVALQLAALKLQNVGRLPDNINIISKLL
ncbi:MAG: carbohydrate kinase family protein [Flavobacteriaceae bacterium]